MAEESRARSVFGRLLSALGFVWVFWALFGELVTIELGTSALNLPILPGFVFLFLGRALSRRARARRTEQEEVPVEPARPSRPASRPRVDPLPTPPRQRLEELKPLELAEPVAVDEVIVEAMESGLDIELGEAAGRKSSAEMVAEAREKFGKRPG